jgi:hypothetical protein
MIVIRHLMPILHNHTAIHLIHMIVIRHLIVVLPHLMVILLIRMVMDQTVIQMKLMVMILIIAQENIRTTKDTAIKMITKEIMFHQKVLI